ncbi:sigma-54-dependent transcriptional regulator [Spongorhabdus nitratireducens]
MDNNKKTILIVDDEPDIRELLEITLGRMELPTVSAASYREALHQLDQQPFSLCLTDMNLPDGNGIDIVRHIQQNHEQMPVAMITAYGSMESAIEALKAGAFDFLAKPVDLTRLRNLVTSALKVRAELPEDDGKERLIGQSEPMLKLRQRITKLARSQAPVFISGESGTGKEVIARMIHEQGHRADDPFIPVNCGAIPSELMESEFFGHRKGSFTGATSDKPGLFQAANGGTLFLDEVADLPLPMQVKLLRAIQEKSVRPVGSEKEIPVDVRILSATHKNLEEEVNDGNFRQDLFYRINVIELAVPPLRERQQDIPLLVRHLLSRIATSHGVLEPEITDDALASLAGYHYPGNVRELENILERASTLCEHGQITAEDLFLRTTQADNSEDKADSPANIDSLEDYLETVERQAITQALEKSAWNKTAAAKKLGITFRALRYRLKKLGME